MNNLNPNTIPLNGRHIIEASAGTGKTYNITELYIRLLLGKKLLPKNILVMTFTKDATQEIIGRVEAKLREVLVDIAKESQKIVIEEKEWIVTKGDENYKHLKRALLEIDEAAIFTIHGFCKKVLSEQAFESGIEMDITMETDTFSILKKTVEQYFRTHINHNKEKFELLHLQGCYAPEKFLDRNKLQNVVLSNYEILVGREIFQDEIITRKKNIKKEIEENLNTEITKYIETKGFQGSFENVLGWLDSSSIDVPEDCYTITKGNLKVIYKEVISIPLKELIVLVENYNRAKEARLIQKICLPIRKDFLKAKQQASVMDFNDLITKLNESIHSSPDLVKTLQTQYPVALIDEFQDTDAEQYEILDRLYPLKNISHSGLDPESLECGESSEILNQVQDDSHGFNTISHSDAGGNLNNLNEYSKDTRFHGYDESTKKPLLLMIGDPKQAIYGFRGGDIFTYLQAKQSCDAQNQWSMDTNWRSTSGMITAYNRLFYQDDLTVENTGCNIFGEGIDYQPVKPSDKAGR